MARMSTRQVTKLCHRLGMALQAGLDVRDALQREARFGRTLYRQQLQQVADRVGRGAGIADAMRQSGSYFPTLAVELIDIGEQTGNLDSVLLRIAEHYQQLLQLRSRFLMGIAWPMLQLLGAICVIGLLILILGLLGASQGVFGLAGPRGLAVYSVVVISVGLIALLLGTGLVRGWFGPVTDAVTMRVPVVGHTIRTMALARLAWALSLALNAGMDACRSIRLALLSTQHPYFTRHMAGVEASVMRGSQFHEALRQTDAFPDDFLQALENAEVSGTESESLAHLSHEYGQQAAAALTTLGYVATIATWGAVAALLISVAFYLFLNLYLAPINEALEMLN